MWQQVVPGAWPQGNNFLTPTTGLMSQNWPVPVAALPMADPGHSSANVNQERVMKELADLTKKFEEEKKRTRDIFTMNSREVVSLKDKISTLEVSKKGLRDKLEKEREKTRSLEKKVEELQADAGELKKEKKSRKLAEEKLMNHVKAAKGSEKEKGISENKKLSEAEKERELRKAKASAKREETLQKIESKKNSKQRDEEWDEDYMDCSGRGVGVISAKRRKSTEGQISSVNVIEVGKVGRDKTSKREKGLIDTSNAKKKQKLEETGKKDEESNEKNADANKKAGAGSTGGVLKVPFKIVLDCKVGVILPVF